MRGDESTLYIVGVPPHWHANEEMRVQSVKAGPELALGAALPRSVVCAR
jgi:hypothetical protein